MRDQYRALMLTSLKDAEEIVRDFNEWTESEFENDAGVPEQAVPQLATLLYQSRVQAAFSDGTSFDLPEFDGKMYE